MKKLNKLTGLLALSLVGALVGCNGGNTGDDSGDEESISLKTVLNNFNSATSYDLTGDISFAIGTTYKSGISTSTYARDYAIEYNEATGGQIVSSFGYANYVKDDVSSVMEYSYDDNGDIAPGYIIDKNTSIYASKKVGIGLKNIDLPTDLKDNVKTYEITPELARGRAFLESITSKAIYGLNYNTLKGLGTIESSVIEASEKGDSFTLTITYAEDATSVANGGKITVTASNFNGGQELSIKDYLEEGGVPKEVGKEAKKLNEYAWESCYIRIESEGLNVVLNLDYGYIAFIYDTPTEEKVNQAYIPVYGVSGLTNNFYVATISDDQSTLDLDITDLTTFEEKACFNESTAAQYFTSLTNMYSIMIYGNLGVNFLTSLSCINDEDSLYMLGDYEQITSAGDYGFVSYESTMVSDIENFFDWSSEDTAEYGSLVGGAITLDLDSDDDAESQVKVYALVGTGSSLIGYSYYYTGFGSDKAKVTAVDNFMATYLKS